METRSTGLYDVAVLATEKGGGEWSSMGSSEAMCGRSQNEGGVHRESNENFYKGQGQKCRVPDGNMVGKIKPEHKETQKIQARGKKIPEGRGNTGGGGEQTTSAARQVVTPEINHRILKTPTEEKGQKGERDKNGKPSRTKRQRYYNTKGMLAGRKSKPTPPTDDRSC